MRCLCRKPAFNPLITAPNPFIATQSHRELIGQRNLKHRPWSESSLLSAHQPSWNFPVFRMARPLFIKNSLHCECMRAGGSTHPVQTKRSSKGADRPLSIFFHHMTESLSSSIHPCVRKKAGILQAFIPRRTMRIAGLWQFPSRLIFYVSVLPRSANTSWRASIQLIDAITP